MADATKRVWTKGITEVMHTVTFDDRVFEVLCFITCYNDVLFWITHVAMLAGDFTEEKNANNHMQIVLSDNANLHHRGQELAHYIQVCFIGKWLRQQSPFFRASRALFAPAGPLLSWELQF
jgi:hypothetical protein